MLAVTDYLPRLTNVSPESPLFDRSSDLCARWHLWSDHLWILSQCKHGINTLVSSWRGVSKSLNNLSSVSLAGEQAWAFCAGYFEPCLTQDIVRPSPLSRSFSSPLYYLCFHLSFLLTTCIPWPLISITQNGWAIVPSPLPIWSWCGQEESGVGEFLSWDRTASRLVAPKRLGQLWEVASGNQWVALAMSLHRGYKPLLSTSVWSTGPWEETLALLTFG